MATPAQWIAGARPRTLPAAVAPVILGTAAAAAVDKANLGLALLALLVAVGLQIGVNYANDYSDGIRGTDAERVGPVRLVGQKIANPGNVKIAAFGAFGFSGLMGLALAGLSGAWIMVPIGALCVLAAWKYTGGDNPYGYKGLGEVFVFVFFGLVATLGTLYTQAHRLSQVGWLSAVGVGAIASAILVANNLRDIPTDSVTGKKTLAVRLGDRGTRAFYLGLLAVSLACLGGVAGTHPWVFLGLAAYGLMLKPIRVLLSGATGRSLVPVLAATGIFELAYAVLLGLGIVISQR
jgi:1,4-dihydroxy-2-naphthoate octaprenyltransferase